MVGIFPFEFFISVKGDLKPFAIPEKQLEDFGMRLRLTGRDTLRLGKLIEGFGKQVTGSFTNIMAASAAWSAGMDYVNRAAQEVGMTIGDNLAPILIMVGNIIDKVGIAMQTQPILAWAVTFLVLIGIIAVVVGVLFQLFGAMALYIGMFLTAQKANLGFTKSLRAVATQLLYGRDAAAQYIAKEKALEAIKKARIELDQEWAATNKKDYDTLKKIMVREKELDVEEKKLRGETEKTSKGFGQAAVAMGGMFFAGILLTQLMPIIDPLLQTIGADLLQVLTPLLPIITAITQWAAANPLLVATIALLIIGLFLLSTVMGGLPGLFSTIGTGIKSMIKTIQNWISNNQEVTKTQKDVSQATQDSEDANTDWTNLANAALIVAIAALIASLTLFFTVMTKNGVTIWEAVGALVAVLGAVLAFVEGLTLISNQLEASEAGLYALVVVILALAAAVAIMTLSFAAFLYIVKEVPGGLGEIYGAVGALIIAMGALLAMAYAVSATSELTVAGVAIMALLALVALAVGEAIALVAENLKPLISELPVAIPLLMAFGAALTVLAVEGAASVLGLVAASIAIGAIAITIGAAAVAILAMAVAVDLLAAALNDIPKWATGIATGVLGAIGSVAGFIGGLPHLAGGGYVVTGGMAVLHPGETVQPAQVLKKKTPMNPITNIYVQAPIGSNAMGTAFAKAVGSELDKRNRRSG